MKNGKEEKEGSEGEGEEKVARDGEEEEEEDDDEEDGKMEQEQLKHVRVFVDQLTFNGPPMK